MSKTKIVCTIGPASWEPKTLKKMIESGMTVVRANAAFTDIPQLKMISEVTRSISDKVALMLDIKGCDVRLNKFDKPFDIKKGDEVIIGSSKEDYIYPVNYPDLYKDLKKGAIIFSDDGNVKAEITKIVKGKMHCKILEGKVFNPGKSINTPGVYLSLPPITEIDKQQIDFCKKDNWDFVAASYIRDRRDAEIVKNYMKGSKMQIIAKIEESMGVSNLDDILEIFDGVMIGRGDMGVEMPYEKIPAIQKHIIQRCNELGKYVITATEVMESMKSKPRPTRAEISDVANAVWDGTDAIMTSGETTVGSYPLETVQAIEKIASENEKYLEPVLFESIPNEEDRIISAITNAAYEAIATANIDKLIIVTQSGKTARFIARNNIDIPVVTYVSDPTVMRQLALAKGIDPILFKPNETKRDKIIEKIIDHAIENKFVNKTDQILVIGRADRVISNFPHYFEYVDLKNWKKLKEKTYLNSYKDK